MSTTITKPLFILGPCSAETREQVLLSARLIQEACGDIPFIFRAGAWKPRTCPRTFQGAGEQALTWLAEAKRTFGIKIATEVATVEHVRLALAAGIDCLWIGARTSANPIAVQEIADEIAASAQKPQMLFVKNPANPDAELWIGNIERMEKTGIPVMAIHRGCDHKPCWAMAHAVRTRRPDIPMLLDPSHMSGDAGQVPALLDKIPELGLNGAMIEIHPNPAEALSDPKQQIATDDLQLIYETLSRRRRDKDETNTRDEAFTLQWLRAEIDELDDRLWDTIAERMNVSKRIGEWKKEHHMTPLQPQRYQQMVQKTKHIAQVKGLSPDFAQQLYDLIHEQSLKQQ